MKKLILLQFLIVWSACIAFGQFYIWTDPVPVTDSITNNVNVNLGEMYFSSGDSLYMVWEKYVDPGSTSIYCRNLQTMTEPFVLLSQPNVHYRNPVIIGSPSGDTLLSVLYETNVNGNWDIFYIKFLKNGTVSSPVPVCNSSENEMNFHFNSNSSALAWEQNDSIYYRRPVLGYPQTPEIHLLDQGNCHHPVLSSDFCLWEKGIGNDTVIMSSYYQYGPGTWSPPSQFAEGVNSNVSGGPGINSFLVWQAREDSFWRIKSADLFGPMFYSVNDFQGANNILPAFYNVWLVTKNGFPIYDSFLSFDSDTTGDREVYVNPNFWDTTYFNISAHPGIDTHPQFFSSFYYTPGYQTVFLFYESWRNNHWQIWMSHIDLPLSLDEKTGSGSSRLNCFPNPFQSSLTVDYTVTDQGFTSIEICNIYGQRVKMLHEEFTDQGSHRLTWDGCNEQGQRVIPGLYCCRMRSGNSTVQQKILVP